MQADQYQVWLLRIWREETADTAVRCSLENTHTGDRRGFATLDDLCEFLARRYAPGQGWNGRDEANDPGEA